MTTDTPRKVELESSDWMLAALKMDCVCDVIGHKCIDCTVHDYLVKLERTLSEREGQLRECVELLAEFAAAGISYDGNKRYDEIQVSKGLQGAAEVLLARLKETL